MKIAFVLYPGVIVSNKSNGIRSQAESWARILGRLGHQVDLVNNWSNYNWNEYDAIHFFGAGDWVCSVAQSLSSKNGNLYFSPIIDYSPSNVWRDTIQYIKGRTKQTSFYKQCLTMKKVFARSKAEMDLFCKGYGINEDKIAIVPLSFTENYEHINVNDYKREKFCLHISSLSQPRKNVIRLIEAAKKYDFELYLAGNPGTNTERKLLEKNIEGYSKIHILGYISEEEKVSLYQRAKVFALPSLCEGVGIVALDAALFGCEVVITNIPGPKEYFKGNCFEVDPYDVDSIGQSIKSALENDTICFQPKLRERVMANYSPEAISRQLESNYIMEE